jgi:hypothetical protein
MPNPQCAGVWVGEIFGILRDLDQAKETGGWFKGGCVLREAFVSFDQAGLSRIDFGRIDFGRIRSVGEMQ